MKEFVGLILAATLLPVYCHAASNAQAEAGNLAYARQAYDEAVEAYRQGLLDQPDSLLLRFNLGTALYSTGNYDEAATAFTAVAASGEDEWIARAAYNLGNTLYRIGESKEAGDPKAAADSYRQALLVYRRAMAADARDEDSKYGHEFVARKLEELLKRQAEQEQQQQGEEQQQSDGGEEKQDSEQGADQGQQQQEAQQQADQPQQQESAQNQQGGDGEDEAQPGGPRPDGRAEQAPSEQEQQESLDRQAARAILDTASAEELGPEDISRAMGIAGEGRPAKDW